MASLLQLISSELLQQDAKKTRQLETFASDVVEGFNHPLGKTLSPRYLYDDLGSTLFEAITLLSEYGLTRADERLLTTHAPEIAAACGPLSLVAELGSGSGKKTTHILRAALDMNTSLSYYPIDVSTAALAACEREIGSFCRVCQICSDWTAGLAHIAARRSGRLPVLLLFLGSSIGNLERAAIPEFLQSIRSQLKPGDFFLLGADLEKNIPSMLAAYDDPTGVTAAFNTNLLGRMNRELGANFDLRSFRHEARWNSEYRRIEMHLVSLSDQKVHIPAAAMTYSFFEGETIWTESSHKFSIEELGALGRSNGFLPMSTWTDQIWPLAEVLWQVA